MTPVKSTDQYLVESGFSEGVISERPPLQKQRGAEGIEYVRVKFSSKRGPQSRSAH